MRVLAIADPHLSGAAPKPMTIFGPFWAGHPESFFDGWREVVRDDDLVLVPGDISWAMRLDEAMVDLEAIAALPGEKVLLRGNHDYWWPSISKLRAALPPRMHALQNDAISIGGVTIAGTRGWTTPGSPEFDESDEKIYVRELERLRLSLREARRLPGRALVVMLHYPPAHARSEGSGFVEILAEARPDAVVYGHLHGEDTRRAVVRIPGVETHLVAADALSFRPKVVLET